MNLTAATIITHRSIAQSAGIPAFNRKVRTTAPQMAAVAYKTNSPPEDGGDFCCKNVSEHAAGSGSEKAGENAASKSEVCQKTLKGAYGGENAEAHGIEDGKDVHVLRNMADENSGESGYDDDYE